MRSVISVDRAKLTKQQVKIMDYIDANMETVSYASAQTLASEIGVDPSTVVRFAQAIGYSGFPELQQAVRAAFLRRRAVRIEPFSGDGEEPSVFHALVTREIQNLAILREHLDVALLHDVAHAIARARRTMVLGFGTAGSIGLVLEFFGRFMGYDIAFEDRGGLYAGADLARLTSDDLLIAVSFWWANRPIVEAAAWAVAQHIPVVAFTDQQHSQLAKLATFVITPLARSDSGYPLIPQCIIPALAITWGLIEALSEIDPARAEAAVRRAEETYARLGLEGF